MPFKSKAQQRLFFALEARGELPKGKALEWARETKNIKRLPERVRKKHASAFSTGLKKVATNLAQEAAELASTDAMQNHVYGSQLDKETGQVRGRATRSGTLNEDRDMDPRYHRKSETSKGGGATKQLRRG